MPAFLCYYNIVDTQKQDRATARLAKVTEYVDALAARTGITPLAPYCFFDFIVSQVAAKWN